MEMKIGNEYTSLACTLCVAHNLVFSSQTDCGDYDVDAIAYAVCSFLRNDIRARSKYVTMSYRMRFAEGEARRAKRCTFLAPAERLGLPDATVRATLSVDPSGVTVESISLYESWRAVS